MSWTIKPNLSFGTNSLRTLDHMAKLFSFFLYHFCVVNPLHSHNTSVWCGAQASFTLNLILENQSKEPNSLNVDFLKDYENSADPRSFGFRRFRSPGWGVKAILLDFWSRKTWGFPKYCVQLDIEKCYDRISHTFILDNVARVNGIQVIPPIIMKT